MRQVRSSILLAMTVLLTASTPPSAERYVLDTSHTHLGFTVRHMMVTNVRGKFKEFSGDIVIDDKDLTKSSASLTIQTASLDTDNDRRDNHLRSDDFFNAAQFPTITFKSKRVDRQGQQLSLVGDLTIRDVTNEVVIPFEMTGPVKTGDRKRIGIEGHLRINRFAYGLTYNRFTEAVQVVAPEVIITVDVEAVSAAP